MRDDPENGTSTQLTPGLIQYICDDGFELNDRNLAISSCDSESGVWSTPVPACISTLLHPILSLQAISSYIDCV